MALVRLLLVWVAIAGIAGCRGGPAVLSCDEVANYQLAVEGERVRVPEDLDALEPMREMPMPEASPQPPRPPNSPCIDRPPEANLGG